MDIGALVEGLARDIALSGPEGVHVETVLSNVPAPLHKAVSRWFNAHEIEKQGDVYVAHDELQWRELTGAPRAGNPVGQLAFELLCAIARHRKGLSAIEAAKQTGQDSRSLFGRVQTLTSLGLVRKFPVLEGGSHTHRLVFHDFYAEPGEAAVDKHRLSQAIAAFVQSGRHGLRLVRETIKNIEPQIAHIKPHRRKPVLRRLFKELESSGVLKRVNIEDSAKPGRTFACLEFLRDVMPSNSAVVDDTGVADIDDDENEDEEDDDDDDDEEMQFTEYKVVSRSIGANLVFPLVNQVFDCVSKTGSTGISGMELTKRLTGYHYRKAVASYLDGLTAGKTGPLVKGVDFHKRVKFYRYFTREAYEHLPPTDFPELTVVGGREYSLRSLEQQLPRGMIGTCSLVNTRTGIKPVFHGEGAVAGETVLVSGAGARSETNAPRKRGRPRKHTPKQKLEVESSQEEPEELRRIVTLAQRRWTGGVYVPASEVNTEEESNGKPTESLLGTPESPVKSELDLLTPLSRGPTRLAFNQRVETVLKIVSENSGIVQGGSHLVDLFNARENTEHNADRRTVNNVCQKLLNEGRLIQVYFDVKTAKGGTRLKYLLCDPSISASDIERAKREVVEREHKVRKLATQNGQRLANSHMVRRLTQEDLEELRPQSRIERLAQAKPPKARKHYGPSAAEVLGVDETSGEPRTKRKRRRAVKAENILASPELMPTAVDTLSPTPEPVDLEIDERLIDQSEIDIDFLARAVIITRSLFTAKLSAPFDWPLVADSMALNVRTVKQYWPGARRQLIRNDADARSADIVFKKVLEFEDAFMKAYINGEVEYTVDGDPAEVTRNYVEWWRNIASSDGDTDSSQETALQMLQKLKLKPKTYDAKRVDIFHALQASSSFVNAERLLSKLSHGVRHGGDQPSKPVRFSNAEMRIRAMVAADNETYEPLLAAQELAGLSNEEAERARSNLVSKRIIRWGENDTEKVPHGRPYVLGEAIVNTLHVPRLDSTVPEKALECMHQFEHQQHPQEIHATIDESEIIPLLEFATAGVHGKRAVLLRSGERVGLLASDYKSRGIDKEELECQLRYEIKTCSDANDVRSQYIEPPSSMNPLRPYIWQTTHLTSKDIWFSVAYRIIIAVLYRPGLTIEALQRELDSALEAEEVEAALRALIDGEVLKRSFTGAYLVVPDWPAALIPP